jgi:hypothetical protein
VSESLHDRIAEIAWGVLVAAARENADINITAHAIASALLNSGVISCPNCHPLTEETSP